MKLVFLTSGIYKTFFSFRFWWVGEESSRVYVLLKEITYKHRRMRHCPPPPPQCNNLGKFRVKFGQDLSKIIVELGQVDSDDFCLSVWGIIFFLVDC